MDSFVGGSSAIRCGQQPKLFKLYRQRQATEPLEGDYNKNTTCAHVNQQKSKTNQEKHKRPFGILQELQEVDSQSVEKSYV